MLGTHVPNAGPPQRGMVKRISSQSGVSPPLELVWSNFSMAFWSGVEGHCCSDINKTILINTVWQIERLILKSA